MIFRVNFALEKKIIFEAFTQLLSIFTDNKLQYLLIFIFNYFELVTLLVRNNKDYRLINFRRFFYSYLINCKNNF